MFEGNLEQQKGFIAIAAPYFTNGYCSAEPEKAAKKGKNCSITLKPKIKLTRKLSDRSLHSFTRTFVRPLTITPEYICRQAIEGTPLISRANLKASLF